MIKRKNLNGKSFKIGKYFVQNVLLYLNEMK